MTDYMWAKPENVQKLMDKYLKEQKDKLIAEFLTDFETVVEYFKLDGHLVGALREKWEGKAK